jgi:hypothetical protein
MQTVLTPTLTISPATHSMSTVNAAASVYQGYQIIRRNGAVVSFEPSKIAVALMKAFLAVHGTQGAASASVRETVDGLTESVVRALLRSQEPMSSTVNAVRKSARNRGIRSLCPSRRSRSWTVGSACHSTWRDSAQ